jgi:hypothetical protein
MAQQVYAIEKRHEFWIERDCAFAHKERVGKAELQETKPGFSGVLCEFQKHRYHRIIKGTTNFP